MDRAAEMISCLSVSTVAGATSLEIGDVRRGRFRGTLEEVVVSRESASDCDTGDNILLISMDDRELGRETAALA
jgi:hypothetical protein